MDMLSIIQQASLLGWLKGNESSKEVLEIATQIRLLSGCWNFVSGEDVLQEYREEAIVAVAQYINSNPRATPQQIQSEIERQVEIFASRVRDA